MTPTEDPQPAPPAPKLQPPVTGYPIVVKHPDGRFMNIHNADDHQKAHDEGFRA